MDGDAQRFTTLDGLRGAAAAAVLLSHAGLALDRPSFVGHGGLAVDVFFAMSGFVLDRAYGARLRAGWPRRFFALARLARLYPLYLIGTLLGLALQLALCTWQGRAADVGGLLLASLFGAVLAPLFRGGGRQMFPLDPPCWSLFVELAVNAGLLALPRWRPVPLAAGVAGAAAVLLTAGLAGVPLLHGGGADCFWVDLARGAFGFGCGLLLSRIEGRGRLARLRGRWTAAAMLALLGVVLVPRGPADVWLDPLAVILLCPTIVALGAAHGRPAGRMRRVCARAGALSYPLYILHAPLLNVAVGVTSPTAAHAPSSRAAAVSVAVALSVALAAAAAHRLEPGSPRRPREPRKLEAGGREAVATS